MGTGLKGPHNRNGASFYPAKELLVPSTQQFRKPPLPGSSGLFSKLTKAHLFGLTWFGSSRMGEGGSENEQEMASQAKGSEILSGLQSTQNRKQKPEAYLVT